MSWIWQLGLNRIQTDNNVESQWETCDSSIFLKQAEVKNKVSGLISFIRLAWGAKKCSFRLLPGRENKFTSKAKLRIDKGHVSEEEIHNLKTYRESQNP